MEKQRSGGQGRPQGTAHGVPVPKDQLKSNPDHNQDKTFERRAKGSRIITHDLFELKEATFMENVGYRIVEPIIQNIQHKHFYHSVDKRGIPMRTSSTNSGHFHRIEYSADANGRLTAKCGPPLRTITKKGPRGKDIDIVEQVFYGAHKATDEGAIFDEHTHEIEYLNSEELKF